MEEGHSALPPGDFLDCVPLGSAEEERLRPPLADAVWQIHGPFASFFVVWDTGLIDEARDGFRVRLFRRVEGGAILVQSPS